MMEHIQSWEESCWLPSVGGERNNQQALHPVGGVCDDMMAFVSPVPFNVFATRCGVGSFCLVPSVRDQRRLDVSHTPCLELS